METGKIVIVVDDHALIRQGLRGLLSADGHVVAEAESFAGLLGLLSDPELTPDLLLLDLALPDVDGIAAVAPLRRARPNLPMLVVTGQDDTVTYAALSLLGLRGVAPKTLSPAIMQAALREVLAGGEYWPPQVACVTGRAAAAQMTERQRDVLLLYAEGRNDEEIGVALGISVNTVRVHMAQVFRLLGTTRFHMPAPRRGLEKASLLGKLFSPV